MTKTVRFRVPNAVHRKLKRRAANANLVLSEYLIHELWKVVKRPTEAQIERRLASLR